MHAILMAILKTMFSPFTCPWTRRPCPHPERCGLTLNGTCHYREG